MPRVEGLVPGDWGMEAAQWQQWESWRPAITSGLLTTTQPATAANHMPRPTSIDLYRNLPTAPANTPTLPSAKPAVYNQYHFWL